MVRVVLDSLFRRGEEGKVIRGSVGWRVESGAYINWSTSCRLNGRKDCGPGLGRLEWGKSRGWPKGATPKWADEGRRTAFLNGLQRVDPQRFALRQPIPMVKEVDEARCQLAVAA
jgi:hypothetical protein